MPLSVPIESEARQKPGWLTVAPGVHELHALGPNGDGGCHSAMHGEPVGRARGEPVGGRGQYDVEARPCAGQPL